MDDRKIRKLNEIRQMEGLCQILLHTDAAQAIGKITVDAKELGVDYLTVVGHKVIYRHSEFFENSKDFISSFTGLELEQCTSRT
jgi:LAS superfamily LD-carboxypeptidase LdcB